MGIFIKSSNSLIPVSTFRSVEVSSSKELQPVRLYNKPSTPIGYTVVINGSNGDGTETIYVQLNDDSTWYYANMEEGGGFDLSLTNIPNVTTASLAQLVISNVYKIKIGEAGGMYDTNHSTGDFANLTFTSTGSVPAYITTEITMTQDSKIEFVGYD